MYACDSVANANNRRRINNGNSDGRYNLEGRLVSSLKEMRVGTIALLLLVIMPVIDMLTKSQ